MPPIFIGGGSGSDELQSSSADPNSSTGISTGIGAGMVDGMLSSRAPELDQHQDVSPTATAKDVVDEPPSWSEVPIDEAWPEKELDDPWTSTEDSDSGDDDWEKW